MEQRYRKIEDQTPWPGLPKVKISKLGNMLSKLVLLNRIKDGGLGAEPPAAGGYGGSRGKLSAAGRFFKKKLFQCHWITFRSCLKPFEKRNI